MDELVGANVSGIPVNDCSNRPVLLDLDDVFDDDLDDVFDDDVVFKTLLGLVLSFLCL
jgi:hypothetical protein